MNSKIFEEGGPHVGHAAGDTSVEKQASQLLSDVKYKVKKEKLGTGTKLNPADVAKEYLARLNQSPAPPEVKAIAKKKLLGTTGSAPSSESSPKNEEVFIEGAGQERQWIVVTDRKTGNTYRRRATRDKISELRSNPNISKVEITKYHPDENDDKQGVKTARVKSGKGLDQDGDGDTDFADVMSARMQASGMSRSAANKKVSDKPYNKKSGKVQEGFSDWRSELKEVVDDEVANQKKTQIKEREVNNKITINPNLDLGETIEKMGGQLIELSEIDEEINFVGVLDDICNAELVFLSTEIIEEAVEEFFLECFENGYEIQTVTEMLTESLDASLEMICEVSDEYVNNIRRQNKIKKIKDTVKKVGKKVAHGVGYAVGKAASIAKKVGSEVKKGYEAGRDSSSDSESGTRKPQTYRYAKKAEEKPSLASRLGSALKSGLKKAVAGGARAVSRGARNVARRMTEELEMEALDTWTPERTAGTGDTDAKIRARLKTAKVTKKPSSTPSYLPPLEALKKKQNGTNESVDIQEVSPPGFEGTVKAMKKHGEIDNPWALAWYMKKKGFKSHRTKSGGVSEATMDATQQDQNQQAASDKPTAQQRKLANIQKQQLAAKLKQVQTGTPLGEGKALGKTSSSDENPKGPAARVSSGGGMTLTKAAGLGKSKSTKDNPAADDLRKKYYDTQAKADRRDAAKERASSGEDRVGRLIRSVQNSSYQPEGDVIDEARAEEKRGLGSTGAQRQKQKKGVVTSSGQVAHPATSYSGGQNPHNRGKALTKTQRRASSRRYVDQPGGVYAAPENQQGAGRYAKLLAKKRDQSHMSSRFD